MQKSISFTFPLLGAARASGTAGDSEAGPCPTLVPHSGLLLHVVDCPAFEPGGSVKQAVLDMSSCKRNNNDMEVDCLFIFELFGFDQKRTMGNTVVRKCFRRIRTAMVDFPTTVTICDGQILPRTKDRQDLRHSGVERVPE